MIYYTRHWCMYIACAPFSSGCWRSRGDFSIRYNSNLDDFINVSKIAQYVSADRFMYLKFLNFHDTAQLPQSL